MTPKTHKMGKGLTGEMLDGGFGLLQLEAPA